MAVKRTERRAGKRGAPPPASKTRMRRVRKNMDMDPVKLATAQQVLGTMSETETVDRALAIAIGQRRLARLMDRLAAHGGLRAYDAQA